VKALALDYGRARTGVAVSDPTGTVVRPLGVVDRAGSERGLDRIAEIVGEEKPDVVVVGLPLTLRGVEGSQAEETRRFASLLTERISVPVDLFDERFTTRLAEQQPGAAPPDARAAAHLLATYLAWSRSEQ
jgi:putative transcription antitermination factor YqgF